jgi:hypothetical protein
VVDLSHALAASWRSPSGTLTKMYQPVAPVTANANTIDTKLVANSVHCESDCAVVAFMLIVLWILSSVRESFEKNHSLPDRNFTGDDVLQTRLVLSVVVG